MDFPSLELPMDPWEWTLRGRLGEEWGGTQTFKAHQGFV